MGYQHLVDKVIPANRGGKAQHLLACTGLRNGQIPRRREYIDLAKELIAKAKKNNVKLLLPH